MVISQTPNSYHYIEKLAALVLYDKVIKGRVIPAEIIPLSYDLISER